MKVIYAGYTKTGTKSMTAVFHEFGYKTYDWLENSWYLGKDWERIIKEGGTVEDFRRMYKGVDAVVDVPCYIYWEQISEAFPEAKIIITIRDDESWIRALRKQLYSMVTDYVYISMQLLSYSGWQHFKFYRVCGLAAFGSVPVNWPWNLKFNEMTFKRLYRTHNCYVLQNAPKDKLLVLNFKDGWGPICEFLGEKVPDKPFPHANIGASIIQEYMENHPIMKRMMREAMFTFGVLTLIGAYGGYKVYQNPASIRGWINAAMTRFKFW
uniref:uncharacterized protein LOC104266799 n=1 Tax=Ciona intestinalis TaxID=7719 RepID=UPI000521A0EF|nr:uncharacterized protein LOC104266799 [Ciona intestinalis]|eukprot:XP_009862167.1 uncharacterized protein LOC104266799 [Ciona intestinalis]